jgi:hypothetical protein
MNKSTKKILLRVGLPLLGSMPVILGVVFVILIGGVVASVMSAFFESGNSAGGLGISYICAEELAASATLTPTPSATDTPTSTESEVEAQRIDKTVTEEITESKNAQALWNALVTSSVEFNDNKPLTRIAAAAIMGNLRAESESYDYDWGITQGHVAYDECEPNICGIGVAQWTSAGRREALLKYADDNNTTWDTQKAQVGYLIVEINIYYKKVDPKTLLYSNPSEAAIDFHDVYEKSNDNAEKKQRRAVYAEEVYAAFSGSNVAVISCAGSQELGKFMEYALDSSNWTSMTDDGSRGIDYDGVYKAQCADIAIAYSYFAGAQSSFDGNDTAAKDKGRWKAVGNPNSASLMPGDVITGQLAPAAKYGHVVLVINATDDGYMVLQQNYPSPHIAKYFTDSEKGSAFSDSATVWRLAEEE